MFHDLPTNVHSRLELAAMAWMKNVFHYIPLSIRGHIVAIIGEYFGTLLFLFFGFAGVQVAKISSNPDEGTMIDPKTPQTTVNELLYISLCFGFSLAVNAWIFFRISGGLFNPAVTLGMWLIGAISFLRMIILGIAQIVAGITAAAIVEGLFSGGLNVDTKLSATTSIAQGVIIEMLLTAQLVFTIFILASEKHEGQFLAPIGIGLSLFIAQLIGVFWTGASLNPARSLGPEIIAGFQHYDWIYWVGPLAGACLAVIFFKIIKGLEYEIVDKSGKDEDVEKGVMSDA